MPLPIPSFSFGPGKTFRGVDLQQLGRPEDILHSSWLLVFLQTILLNIWGVSGVRGVRGGQWSSDRFGLDLYSSGH